jgi:hypothetical protein
MEDDAWPALNNYEGCWPVRSILKMILKYSAEKSRRNDLQDSQRRVRDALRGPSQGVGVSN